MIVIFPYYLKNSPLTYPARSALPFLREVARDSHEVTGLRNPRGDTPENFG